MEKTATNTGRITSTHQADRPAANRGGRPAPAPSRPGTPPVAQPRFTRLTASLDLTPPPGCVASIVLKQVGRDEHGRYYVWWMMAGRNGDDAFSVHYKHTGEDMIRCDIPDGMVLSEEALEPGLKAFWASLSLEPTDPPIGSGGGGGGPSGGTH